MPASLNFTFGALEEPPHNNDLLYYYCSMDTFASIIRTKRIWLRSLMSMNDPSEMLLHKVNIADAVYKQYLQTPFEFKYVDQVGSNAMHAFLYPPSFLFNAGLNDIKNNIFFALCLSSNGNLLSQWRMYADNGKGVCLGFSKSKIKEFIKDSPNYKLQDIEYYDDIVNIIDAMSKELLDTIQNLYSNNRIAELHELRANIPTYFMPNWSKYKKNDYSNENETRLVCHKHSNQFCMNINASEIDRTYIKDIEWASINGKLDLHMELDIKDLGLSTITFGPANETTKEQINLVLAKEELYIPNDKIYKSKIPYRG